MVSFYRAKGVPKGGPDGGDGGYGGSVIVQATNRLNTLSNYISRKKFNAADGEKGGTKNCHGKKGDDLVLLVPVGTVIFFIKQHGKETVNEVMGDLVEDGQQLLIASGGRGGFGNFHFKAANRQSPDFAEAGSQGDHHTVKLELRLLADVGLVGFPNAGKSTLISRVSNARPKIANYPFTTLIPNLGVTTRGDDHLVVADIPGLIEGAAEGKGLGHEFLRHVARCRLILHMIDATGDDWVAQYKTIRSELIKFDPKLAEKKELIVVNKIDAQVADADVQLKALKKLVGRQKIYQISAVTGDGVKPLFNDIFTLASKLPVPQMDSDQHKVFTFEDIMPDMFEVKKLASGFRIQGKKIEELAHRLNFSSWQARERFFDIIARHGAVKQMKKLGLKAGDKIWIGEKVVEY